LFAQEGAKVLLVDLDEDTLRKVVGELNHPNVSYVAADVSKASEVEKYVRTAVDRYDGIDVFFDNAGVVGQVVPIKEYPEEEFDRVIAVNLKGAWLGLKYVMPVMERQGGGSIMITSSVAGMKGFNNMVAYVTSKHAVIGMMRVAALEGAPYNIRVNAINPGPVDNSMMRSLEKGYNAAQPEEAKKGFEAMTPLGRYCKNEEVAQLALFLASDESQFITGCLHPIDGGLTV
jgi:NAD(P)-dependent dehydrogenase (short-subunit alcohol dehydrogenase family)